jgi:hypothetical protein
MKNPAIEHQRPKMNYWHGWKILMLKILIIEFGGRIDHGWCWRLDMLVKPQLKKY